MGDRFYRQIGDAKGLKTVAEIMNFCQKPYRPGGRMTKKDYALELGSPSLEKLTLADMETLSSHLVTVGFGVWDKVSPGGKKADVVRQLKEHVCPNIDWNKPTQKELEQAISDLQKGTYL